MRVIANAARERKTDVTVLNGGNVNVIERFHMHVSGHGARPMLFVHGYGCDQSMWRFVAPAFERSHRVHLFDLAGCGGAESAWSHQRHASLAGYAQDVLDIVQELGLQRMTVVGHSVGAIIAALAVIARPAAFERLVMVSPSPSFITQGDYPGGFSRADIDGLIETLESNYMGWASSMAAVIMGTPDRPELVEELWSSFCRMRPDIARAFARVTFLSDHRADLPRVSTRTLVLQVTDDALAPVAVGRYVQQQLRDAELQLLSTRGHCPHLSAPELTIAAMRQFLPHEGRDG
jgi:sigma-B regulation protein RsbQ